MKFSIEQLNEAKEWLESTGSPFADPLLSLVRSDIQRRQNAGRKKVSKYDRKEQNRLAQKALRNRRDLQIILDKRRSKWSGVEASSEPPLSTAKKNSE